ncbi:hypothetical protein [uncultured Paraglaciecola sp.]|uniref:hypothetical protein n=1 Tax=uncultured Paraglaciecola sp. TaxID=1765024 RepID=UPI00262DAD47|nr:hypothetical protein [uncultured Paraglaciecola sp.]
MSIQPLTTAHKCEKVIRSCQTEEQLECAALFVRLAIRSMGVSTTQFYILSRFFTAKQKEISDKKLANLRVIG